MALRPTLGLYYGFEFEIRLASGNDSTEREYKIIKMFFRMSPALNQSRWRTDQS